MRDGLNSLLDQLLDDLLAGRAGVDDLIARHPEREAELRPLLEAAVALRASDGAIPAPQDMDLGWIRIEKALDGRRAKPSRMPAPLAAALGWFAALSWRGRVRTAVIVGAVGLVGASGLAAAAGGVDNVSPFRLFTSSSRATATPTPPASPEASPAPAFAETPAAIEAGEHAASPVANDDGCDETSRERGECESDAHRRYPTPGAEHEGEEDASDEAKPSRTPEPDDGDDSSRPGGGAEDDGDDQEDDDATPKPTHTEEPDDDDGDDGQDQDEGEDEDDENSLSDGGSGDDGDGASD